MLTILLAVGVAATSALLVVLGGTMMVNRQRLSRGWVVRTRLMETGREIFEPTTQILRGVEVRKGLFERMLEVRSLATVVDDAVRRAGLRWTANEFGSYVVIGLTAGLLSSLWLPLTLTVLLTVAGAFSPLIVLRVKRSQRERKVETQIPEALDMLVSSIRAGLSLQAGMQFVGHELPAPVGPEFARFYDEQRLGVDVKQALLNFQERLGTVDARMIVLAIMIQRETGGNLAEVLGSICAVIRERIRFREQVSVMTAESKASAWMLSALPIIMFFGFQLANPEYMHELTYSPKGQSYLMYAVGSLIVGMVLLNKLSKIED